MEANTRRNEAAEKSKGSRESRAEEGHSVFIIIIIFI